VILIIFPFIHSPFVCLFWPRLYWVICSNAIKLLYLDIKPLSSIQCIIQNVFFYFVCHHFTLFPLLCRSFLVWCNPIFHFCFLLSVLLGTYPKNHWPNQHLKAFSHVFFQ
jgi:hypothetical protein